MFEPVRWPLLQLLCIVPVLCATAHAQEAADELSRQATDPTASLMSLNAIADYTGDDNGAAPGLDDDSFDLKLQSVIPFKAFDKPNILRLSIPYRASGRGENGLGSVSVFDLMVFNHSRGRWGVGAVATLSPHGSTPDGFVVGPAVGSVWQLSPKLSVGVFNQNVFGDDTAISQFQPIIAYQLGNGWALSAGDLQWAYDWKGGGWQSQPIGVQLGKVTRLGGQPVRFAINPQYNLVDDDGTEAWSVALTFTLLVPGS